MRTAISVDIYFKKNEQRLRSGQVEQRGVGWERKGPFYILRGGGSEIFDDLLGRGSEFFHLSSCKLYHKPPITPTLSDYFLFN